MSNKYDAPLDANKDPSVLIDYFRGDYDFCSNMYKCVVWYKGIEYPSSEHAYMAAKIEFDGKLLSILHRIKVSKIKSPGDAKKYGKTVVLAPGFDENKIQIMKEILFYKFTQNDDLAERLLNTGEAMIVEGNTWWDRFWGVCQGEGENHLGKLLMEIRDFLPQYYEHMDMISESELGER